MMILDKFSLAGKVAKRVADGAADLARLGRQRRVVVRDDLLGRSVLKSTRGEPDSQPEPSL